MSVFSFDAHRCAQPILALLPRPRRLAAPIKNFRGDVVAAMTISVDAGRMGAGQMAGRCLPTLIKYRVERGALL